MNVRSFLIALGLVLFVTIASVESKEKPQDFTKATPGKTWYFPKDHGEHPSFKTEWWYYTGNLSADDGRRFGYQLTFFRTALGACVDKTSRASKFASSQLYLAHFAISDLQSKKHYSSERISRGHPSLASITASPFKVYVDTWTAKGKDPGNLILKAETKHEDIDFKLELHVSSKKDIVFQGQNGFSQKGYNKNNASYYYSYTRLKSEGQIQIGSKLFQVSGQSWMDHEFSTSLLERQQKGWDWFSIQLENNDELMLFQLRDERGGDKNYFSGLYVKANGKTSILNMNGATFESKQQWKSKRTGTVYPTSWKLTIPQEELKLNVNAAFENQEMKTSVPYWEGVIDVKVEKGSEKNKGFGYMELTGYGESIQKNFR